MREAESTPLIPELADLRGAARGRAVIAEARVALAARLGVQPGEALQHLIWLARDLDMELEEAAALVIGAGDQDGAVPGERPTASVMPLVDAAHAVEDDPAVDERRLAEVEDDPAARAVLDASIDAAVHLVPVRGAEGVVLDFLYAAANEATTDLFGRKRDDLVGKRLLRLDPGSALLGLFASYVEAFEKKKVFKRGPFEFSTAQEGVTRTSRMTVHCVPVPTGVCVSWRYHDDEERMRRRLERVGRLALMGFAEWDLATDEMEWSDQMARNYGLDPARPAPMLDELSKLVVEEDRPLVEERIQTMVSRRAPVEMEHRVLAPEGDYRHLWVFAEPVLDESGRPVSVNLVSQDITRRRGVERALAETRREMLRQQARTAQERRVAVTLRRAILPDPDEVISLPGLRVAIRSLAAESTARIGGDWFATRALPDGRSLFAIGDAAGHGLPAAAAMARTRIGLMGLVYTGQPPGRLMGWLNEMVGQLEPEPAATGTALLARYDPRTCVMQWSCAGHLPPILVRDGEVAQLDIDPGPMLGALPSLGYRTVTTRLRSGDLVLLYTDGLVERRDGDLDEQIARLMKILEGAPEEPEAVLDQVLARMGHDRKADDTTLFAVRVE